MKEIKEGYFSVLVDSTLDISSVDQLTVIVRYVSLLVGIPGSCRKRKFQPPRHVSDNKTEENSGCFLKCGNNFQVVSVFDVQ